MKWEIGAKMRILNSASILGGRRNVTDGETYVVNKVEGGDVYITGNFGDTFHITEDEHPYVERMFTAVDYAEIARRAELGSYGLSDTERNAELGQPSESCECDCVGIAEELADIKEMIGRLLKEGETTYEEDDAFESAVHWRDNHMESKGESE